MSAKMPAVFMVSSLFVNPFHLHILITGFFGESCSIQKLCMEPSLWT